MAHGGADLDGFAQGENAQVVARDRRTGELVFLPRGGADAIRVQAKEFFECPLPACDAPRPLTTRGGSRRDHFVHLAPHTHPGGPESLHHFQGKHLIAEWARTVTDADVEVNEEEWSADIRRRADVMVTWPDGRQVAFEIEYKRSAAARFREKNDDYRRRGITPVWLFGHTSAYLRPDSRVDRDAALFRLTSVTEQVAAADLPVLFINPSEANVGTLSREQESLAEARERSPRWWDRVDAVGERPVTPMDRSVGLRLSVDALNECLLTPEAGLVSPAMKRIDEVRRAVSGAADRDKATEERQAEARRKRASEEAQAYQERKRREAREAPPTPSGVTGPGRCVVCGGVMDPVLSTGRHILC